MMSAAAATPVPTSWVTEENVLLEFRTVGREARPLQVSRPNYLNRLTLCADFVVKVGGEPGPDRMSVLLVLLRVRTRHLLRMHGVAGCFRRTRLEEVVNAGARDPPVSRNGVGRRQDRIEDDAADAFGVVAHERLRQIASI